MKKIYIIITALDDIYCAATSKEKAQKIIDMDIKSGSLDNGAKIHECNLYNKASL